MNIVEVNAAEMGTEHAIKVPGVADHILEADEAAKWCAHLVKEIGSSRLASEWEERLTDETRAIIDHFCPLIPEYLDQFVVEALGLQWALLGGLDGPKQIALNARRVNEVIDALLPHARQFKDPQNPGDLVELIIAESHQPEVITVVLEQLQNWLRYEAEDNDREAEELGIVYGVTLVTLCAVEPELRRCLVSD